VDHLIQRPRPPMEGLTLQPLARRRTAEVQPQVKRNETVHTYFRVSVN
jgi:hypothetical protein